MHSSKGNAQTVPAPRSTNRRDTRRESSDDRKGDEQIEELVMSVPEFSEY